MKFAAFTAAALLAATNAQAFELGTTGISLGLETTAEYNIDAENMTLVTTPELAYNAYGMFNLTVGADLDIYDDEFVFGDVAPTLDFGVSTHVRENVKLYLETGYDLEAEDMSDVVVGATFAF